MSELGLCAITIKKYKPHSSKKVIEGLEKVLKRDFTTTSINEKIANVLSINLESTIIIKSTVAVGYIEKVRAMFETDNIIFSSEFLREDKTLYNNLYPSRIIVGEQSKS